MEVSNLDAETTDSACETATPSTTTVDERIATANSVCKRSGIELVQHSLRTSKYRSRDAAIFWRTMFDLGSVPRTPPGRQIRDLQEAFVGSYWCSHLVKSQAQYMRVYHWMAPRSRAMNASRDALVLLHLGTRHCDDRLLNEGRTRHLAALRCLSEEIEKPGAASDDGVLGAAYTMAQCEVYRVVSHEGSAWMSHIPGLCTMFAQRGAKHLNSPFSQAVAHNLQQVVVRNTCSCFAMQSGLETNKVSCPR
ncbi:hypothetical protein BAUCODRAFT_180222 [Baudoinia panamericana UAMH 10762]|uniref:Uncharacterized protein n=1 Tax=Baudoinia panamericana (strain UAMH 10762) TaxID=717646 RepID=M2N953_BAUPA|nr:uncharacterized protein BAUCODRAFT_180222 [Baudoinia panamericana UAMH 10762]EMD00694.1 hypothetical protein BAUCODRAFT_180222 [Baudoinia panamericana UAMH 10762]